MPAESGERFVVRSYRPGDERAILELFARSFHQPRTLEHWRWKYAENPYGNERISETFDAEERLVGHYSGYPVPYYLSGRSVEAHHIGDTMTDPSIRHIGRGPTSVLGRTALHFYATFCEGRVAFNYGFNVANIQKFSLRFLRSDRVVPVDYRFRDLVRDPLRPLSRAERWLRGIRLQVVNAATNEWDALFSRVAPHYRFLIQRDSWWVNWRYLQCPDVRYIVVAIRKWHQLIGWIVFRIREERLAIGDALMDPDHADAFEAAVRHLAAVYPVRAIEGWFPPRPLWFREVLESLRLMPAHEPQDLSVMCVPFVEGQAVAEMREALYYTMADSDLF
jgi:hypothetical protein